MPIPSPSGINPYESPVCLSLTCVMVIYGLLALKNQRLFFKGIMHPASVNKQREFYRLFSSDFVHNDLMHLLINGFALFAIGSELEEYLRSAESFGSLKFLAIYLTSCLFGTGFTYLRHKNDFEFSSAGASGSILGCMMSFMILQPYHIAFYLPVFGGVVNLYSALIYIVFLIAYQWRSDNALVNNEVHFFGALGGIIATFMLKP